LSCFGKGANIGDASGPERGAEGALADAAVPAFAAGAGAAAAFVVALEPAVIAELNTYASISAYACPLSDPTPPGGMVVRICVESAARSLPRQCPSNAGPFNGGANCVPSSEGPWHERHDFA